MCGGILQTVFIAFTLLCCAELASGARIGEEQRGDSVAASQQAVVDCVDCSNLTRASSETAQQDGVAFANCNRLKTVAANQSKCLDYFNYIFREGAWTKKQCEYGMPNMNDAECRPNKVCCEKAAPSDDDADDDNTVDDMDVDDSELDDIIEKAAQSGARKAGVDLPDRPDNSTTPPEHSTADRKSKTQSCKDKAMKAMGLDRPKKLHKPKVSQEIDKKTVLETEIEKAVAAAVEDVKECKKFENKKAVSEGARPGSAAASELPSALDVAKAAGEAAANVAKKANMSEKIQHDEYFKAFTAAQESATLEKIVKDATPAKEKAQANAARARIKLLKVRSQAARADAKEKMANAQLVNLQVQEAAECMEARLVQDRATADADVEAGNAVEVDPEILAFDKELETTVSKGLAKALLAGKTKEEAAKMGGRAVATIAAAAKTSPDEAARIAAAAASDIGFPSSAVAVCGGAAAEAVALKNGKTEEEAKKLGEGAAKTVKDAQDDEKGGESDDDAVETTSESPDEKNETSAESDADPPPTEE